MPFMIERNKKNRNLKLYVKKVFITDDCEELVPEYLNFVKGIVDSNDLPLNVSREMLQQSSILKIIRKQIVKKCIETLSECADNDNDKFMKFYKQYSKNLKLGIHEDKKNRNKLIELLRFFSIKNKEHQISLKEYVDNMKPNQKDIYYIIGESMKSIESSPFLEILQKKEYDVLLMTDPIDEYAMQQVKEYNGKKLADISKTDLKLDDEISKEEKDKLNKEYDDLCKFIKTVLGDKIEKVIISDRLVDSPCALTTSQYGLNANMERILKAQAMGDPNLMMHMSSKKNLELNPNSKLINILRDKFDKNKDDKMVKNLIWLFYETSLITSGFTIENPSSYGKRIYNILALELDEQIDSKMEIDSEYIDEDIPSLDPDDNEINNNLNNNEMNNEKDDIENVD